MTAAAAAVAWALAAALSAQIDGWEIPPIVASITAVLTVRPSLHRATGEAGAQLLATGIGAVLAVAVVDLGWADWFAAGVVVFGSFLASRLLRLADEAAVGVPVTALIVLGPGLPAATAVDRLLGTAVGAVVAVGFSFFTRPDTPAVRAADAVAQLGDDTASLLSVVADATGQVFPLEVALGWLDQARALDERVPGVRAACEEAVAYARWYPRASQAEAAAVFARFLAVEHTVVTVRAITRSLVEVAERDIELTESTRDALSGALMVAAQATSVHAATLATAVELAVEDAEVGGVTPGPGDVLTGPVHDELAVEVARLEVASDELASQAGALLAGDEAADRDAGVMTAAVAVSVARIADSLSMETDAIRTVSPVAPGGGVSRGSWSGLVRRSARRVRRFSRSPR